MERTLRPLAAPALLALVAGIAVTACSSSTSTNDTTPDGPDGGAAQDDGGAPPVVDCPAPTKGPTVHAGGHLAADETWTADASPHIVQGDVSVLEGKTLTIEPCAVVELEKGKHIQVAYPGTPNTGTLVAEGTATKPITFKGHDGARWASLYVEAPGTARLRYVTLEGGGGGDFEDGATIDAIGDRELPADPILLVDHVTIDGSLGTGIWMQGGANFQPGSTDLTVKGSGNDESPYPLEITEHAMDALPTGSYTGNKIDEIRLETYGYGVAGGGLTIDATLHDRGVPYHVGRGQGQNFTIGRAEDGPVATMTIEAGVTMKFEKDAALRVQTFTTDKPSQAVIRALGTADKPVVFTSAAAQPSAGDWRGLWFGGVPQATNQLDHVRIEYAGADCGCVLVTCSNNLSTFDGAIVFTAPPPSPFITNSVFSNVKGNAITEGFDGSLVNFRPTNTFEGVGGCVQTLPRLQTCPDPKPACDGM